MTPIRTAAVALAAAATLIAPAAAQANHHACPTAQLTPAQGSSQIRVDARAGLDHTGKPQISFTKKTYNADGSTLSIVRNNCTPVFVPAPIGGPTSPLPAQRVDVPLPIGVPIGFMTPRPPDLGANGDLFPPFDPLRPLLPAPFPFKLLP